MNAYINSVAFVLVTLVTMKISDFVIDSRVGAVDRAFGFLFGAARGVLLLVIALLFFSWLVPSSSPTWVANAQSRPFLHPEAALMKWLTKNVTRNVRSG